MTDPLSIPLGEVVLRGVLLGSSQVSAQVHIRTEGGGYTMLVGAKVARTLAPFIGCKVRLVVEVPEPEVIG